MEKLSKTKVAVHTRSDYQVIDITLPSGKCAIVTITDEGQLQVKHMGKADTILMDILNERIVMNF